jgi:hypothetical protein
MNDGSSLILIDDKVGRAILPSTLCSVPFFHFWVSKDY